MIVGNMAPAFTADALVNGKIQKISLGSYLGKWVILFFYSGDFSFVCPTELASIAVSYKEFQALNTEILSINSDSVYTHKMLIQDELSKMIGGNVPYPMLSDVTGNISRAYDVFDEQQGTTLRGTFIIDAEGYVQGMEVLTTPVGRNSSELLRKLKAFQTYASSKNFIPADWNPGDVTLKELIEAIGNISTMWKPNKKA